MFSIKSIDTFVAVCIPRKLFFQARYKAPTASITSPIGQVIKAITAPRAEIPDIIAGNTRLNHAKTLTSPVTAPATIIILAVSFGFASIHVATFSSIGVNFANTDVSASDNGPHIVSFMLPICVLSVCIFPAYVSAKALACPATFVCNSHSASRGVAESFISIPYCFNTLPFQDNTCHTSVVAVERSIFFALARSIATALSFVASVRSPVRCKSFAMLSAVSSSSNPSCICDFASASIELFACFPFSHIVPRIALTRAVATSLSANASMAFLAPSAITQKAAQETKPTFFISTLIFLTFQLTFSMVLLAWSFAPISMSILFSIVAYIIILF